MTLSGGTGSPRMIGLESLGFLESYYLDRTFQIRTPQGNDPQNTNPHAPASWQPSDEEGYSNPIVGRVYVQCAEALNNKTPVRGNVERIRVALHSCKENMRNCEKAFRRLLREQDRIVTEITAAGGLRPVNGVVNNMPSIPDLDHDSTVFLTCAKRSLQHMAEVLNEFYGINILNARFDIGRTQLGALTPRPDALIDVLNHFDSFVVRVLALRNGQDHTPRTTIVTNFQLVGTSIQPPSWRVGAATAPQPMLLEMRNLLAEAIEFAEQVFFFALLDNIEPPPGPFVYVVEPVSQTESAEYGSIRYRCELKFAQPTENPTQPSQT